MILYEPDDKPARMLHHSSWQPNEGEPDGLHPFCSPGSLKDELFHRRVKIEGEDHDPLPGGVFAECRRGQFPSRKVLFHNRMGFLTLPAPLVQPIDQFSAFRVSVGHNTEDFIAFPLHAHGRERKLNVPLHPRKFWLL